MATPEQHKAMSSVEMKLCVLLDEMIQEHGASVAIAGAVMAVASLIGTLDRNPNARALASWQRSFTVVYDATLYASDIAEHSAGEA